MQNPDESTATPGAARLTRADVERWRAEAEAFFVSVRRELSCLTGEAPRPRSTRVSLEAAKPPAAPSLTLDQLGQADTTRLSEEDESTAGPRIAVSL